MSASGRPLLPKRLAEERPQRAPEGVRGCPLPHSPNWTNEDSAPHVVHARRKPVRSWSPWGSFSLNPLAGGSCGLLLWPGSILCSCVCLGLCLSCAFGCQCLPWRRTREEQARYDLMPSSLLQVSETQGSQVAHPRPLDLLGKHIFIHYTWF